MTVRENEMLADALILDRDNLVKYISQTAKVDQQLLTATKALKSAQGELITNRNTIQQLQTRLDGMQDYIDGEIETNGEENE